MALFTRRERIAIAVISLFILLGWGIRLGMLAKVPSDDLRVIRGAVQPPAILNAPDTLSVSNHGGIKVLTVDINTAQAAELEKLPSIGPSRAAAIISYREEHGLFSIPGDIMKVPGIGPGIFRQIKTHITVSESAEGSTTKK